MLFRSEGTGPGWLTPHKKTLTVILLAAPGVLALVMLPYIRKQIDYWGELLPAHYFTQGRLLWVYLAKSFVPTGLCSDHLIP